MKLVLFAGAALYLCLAVQRSIAQDRNDELNPVKPQPVFVSTNTEASIVNRIDVDRDFELRRNRKDFYGILPHNANTNFRLTDSIWPMAISAGSNEITKYPVNAGVRIGSPSFDITGLMCEQKSNGYLIQIQCSKKLRNCESWLKREGNDTWLSVSIADAKVDSLGIELIKMPEFIKEFLIFQARTSAQLTFKLMGRIRVAELIQDKSSNNIFVAVHTTLSFPVLARIYPQLVKHLSLTRKEVW
jgi:hypothetical protein